MRSRKKWRKSHPSYQKQYWLAHPKAAEHNRQQQHQRDRRRRLRHLVRNNPLVFDRAAVYKQVMLRMDQINNIHRLASSEHGSMRRIARQLHVDTRSVKKYLQTPVATPIHRPRPLKLDSLPTCSNRTPAFPASSFSIVCEQPAIPAATSSFVIISSKCECLA